MGLASWDQLGDDYNYAQLAGNFNILDFHDHSAGRGVQIPAGGLAPGAVLSSNIAANAVGTQHMALSTAQNLGLNIPGSVGRGYTAVTASQSTSSGTFTTLATPDVVNNIVLTTGGLIHVAYHATWQESVTNTANAALFLGTNQITSLATQISSAPTAQYAYINASINTNYQLVTYPAGLVSDVSGIYGTDATTGQTLGSVMGTGRASPGAPGASAYGGPCYIWAAPGTYNISVQFRVSSGTVSVSNRRLWVWVVNFN